MDQVAQTIPKLFNMLEIYSYISNICGENPIALILISFSQIDQLNCTDFEIYLRIGLIIELT